MRVCALALSMILGTVTPAVAGEFTLDDLEDGDRVSNTGLSWVGITDSLLGGASRVRLSIVGNGGAAGTKKALLVEGDLAGTFAGAWVPLEARGQAVDLRAFRSGCGVW